MTTQTPRKLGLPFACSLLLVVAFTGCMSETQLLNTAAAGDGGDGDPTGTGGQASAGRGGGQAVGGGPASGGSAQAVGGGPATGGGQAVGGGPATGGGQAVGGGPATGGTGQAVGGGPATGGTGQAVGGGPATGGTGQAVGGGPATGGTGSATGGSSGVGGGAVVTACTSTDGSGCETTEFCVDRELDGCTPVAGTACDGLCATQFPVGRCRLAALDAAPDSEPCGPDFECVSDPLGADPVTGSDGICVSLSARTCDGDDDCADGFVCSDAEAGKRCLPVSAKCTRVSSCDVLPAACPVGFALADGGVCNYGCVPLDHCGCTRDSDCYAPSTCDQATHRCEIAKAPAPRCLEPFDAGPCDAAFKVFAFIDGKCQPAVYGGCYTNDNRFYTLEECLSTCEGAPLEHECPAGRVAVAMCPECGPVGGCPEYGEHCAVTCGSDDDCKNTGFLCYEGICQVSLCE